MSWACEFCPWLECADCPNKNKIIPLPRRREPEEEKKTAA